MIGPLANLIEELARLPSLGRRSAERMAQHLAWHARERIPPLMRCLQDVAEQVRACGRCAGLTVRDQDPCRLCTDPRRDAQVLCVVGRPGDIARIEDSGGYRGRYHALLGRWSAASGQRLYETRKAALLQRVAQEGIREVVLALDSDVEGDACAADLGQALEPTGVCITRIAFGLPAGSGIAYADPSTLSHALSGRRRIGGRAPQEEAGGPQRPV